MLWLGFIAFVLLLGLAVFVVLAPIWLVRKLVSHWPTWSGPKRLCVCGAVLAAMAMPVLAYKAWDYENAISRVPEPLRVARIEYREEQSWGIGPGGNETGFIVYRLTDKSADWAKAKSTNLPDSLLDGTQRWLSTPVADHIDGNDRWHHYDKGRPITPHGPDITEYLGKYGFDIPLDRMRVGEFNQAIRKPGSFYAYGRGGSITVIDPEHRKVYFAYAG